MILPWVLCVLQIKRLIMGNKKKGEREKKKDKKLAIHPKLAYITPI